jgi:hypothetical protein
MTGTFPIENNYLENNRSTAEDSNYDFNLGITDFRFSDLYRAERLKELAETFYAELEAREPVLAEALTKYIADAWRRIRTKGRIKILTDAAPYLSDFIARLFGINATRENLASIEINEQDPVWKYKFFVQRRAIKKFPAETAVALNQNELSFALNELRHAAFDETLIHDDELSISEITTQLLEAEELLTKNQPLTASAEKKRSKKFKRLRQTERQNFRQTFRAFANEVKRMKRAEARSTAANQSRSAFSGSLVGGASLSNPKQRRL